MRRGNRYFHYSRYRLDHRGGRLRGSLFWRVFLTFFSVLFLEIIAFLALIAFQPLPEAFGREALARQIGPTLEALAAQTVAREGPAALGAIRVAGQPRIFDVQPAGDKAPSPGGTMVTTGDGTVWRVRFVPPVHVENTNPILAASYMSLVITALLVAAGAAVHFLRPIWALRDGVKSFAAGNRQVRLAEQFGNRSAEFEEIARGFDRMADQGEELIRSRERLIDDMAHELRSPLARLQLAIAIARQKSGTDDLSLERIEREALRLEKTADSLLTLSQLENGAAQLDRYFDMTSLVEETVADARFEGQAREVGISLETGESEAPIDVRGDAELLRRAIENVLRNALRFSSRGQTIAVCLTASGESVTLTIEDNGPGVPEEQVADLFEPFSRGAGDVGGYGLGLAIARRAVGAHGGTISAENRESGGLRAVINIPIRC